MKVRLLPLWRDNSLGIQMPSVDCRTTGAAPYEPGGPNRRRWGSRRASTSVAQRDATPRRKPT